MPDIVYGADQRLIGTTSPVAALTSTRILVANPLLKKMVTIAFSGSAPNVAAAAIEVQAASAALAFEPTAVAVAGGHVAAVGVNALAYRADDSGLDAEGYALTTIAVDCARPAWIAALANYVFLPSGAGGVQVYEIGVGVIAAYEGVGSRIDYAVVNAPAQALYLFDGARGKLIPASIANGLLSFQPEVDGGCMDLVGASVGSAYLVVAAEQRLTLLSLADPLAPSLLGHRDIPGYRIAAIANVAANAWWIATDRLYADQADRFDYGNVGAVFIPAFGVYALSARTGRLIGEGSFTSLPPSYVVPGTPDGGDSGATFFILTEATDPIDQESAGRLNQELAP